MTNENKAPNLIDKDKVIAKLREAFLDKNVECDGPSCTGCWKDVIREAIKMLEVPLEQVEQGAVSKFVYIVRDRNELCIKEVFTDEQEANKSCAGIVFLEVIKFELSSPPLPSAEQIEIALRSQPESKISHLFHLLNPEKEPPTEDGTYWSFSPRTCSIDKVHFHDGKFWEHHNILPCFPEFWIKGLCDVVALRLSPHSKATPRLRNGRHVLKLQI